MKVRKALSLKEKLKIIDYVKRGKKQVTVAMEFNIPASTVSTIVKNEDKINKALSSDCFKAKRKRLRGSSWPGVEKAVLLWIKNVREKKIAISGPILRQKAEELALKLKVDNFSASDGWLSRFKERHSLVFRSVCGEAASVNVDETNDWLKQILLPALKDYPARNVFNADETGLFFELQPNKTIAFSKEDCHGGKKSKKRITLMVCCNMDGSEKVPLLTIGKFRKPRCFKGLSTLPTSYENNKNAWITQDIFEKWLRKLDRKFNMQNRKILFLVDNCSAHFEVEGLLAIKLLFFPANTTSVLQPMDQGVIWQLKKAYQHKLLQKMLFCIEHGVPFEINILKAMHLIASSWKELSVQTIQNCYKHAGFTISSESSAKDSVPVNQSEVRHKLKDLVDKLHAKGAEVDQNFDADDNIPVCATLSDDDIVKEVLESGAPSRDSDDDNHEDDSEVKSKPSHLDVCNALDCLQTYFSMNGTCESSLAQLYSLESKFLELSLKCKNQSTLDDFFKPT